MGYRSDGVLAITKEGLAKLLIHDVRMPEILSEMKSSVVGDHHYWTYQGFKMYEQYPDVAELHQWLDFLEETVGVEDFAYIRLGEDDDDILSMGDPYEFDIHIERSISTTAEW